MVGVKARVLFLASSYFTVSAMVQRNHAFAALLAFLLPSCSDGQNTSAAGSPWVESEYTSSPPVYPSRKLRTVNNLPHMSRADIHTSKRNRQRMGSRLRASQQLRLPTHSRREGPTSDRHSRTMRRQHRPSASSGLQRSLPSRRTFGHQRSRFCVSLPGWPDHRCLLG